MLQPRPVREGVVAGDEDHGRSFRLDGESFGDDETIELRELDVEKDDVGVQTGGLGQGLDSIGSRADYVKPLRFE
jgi:hypothetical protein